MSRHPAQPWRFLGAALVATVLAVPVAAQDSDDGSSSMRRGLEMFLDGLQEQISPHIADARAFLGTVGPAMQSFLSEMGRDFALLIDEVEDWSVYDPPERLPNGDIIIRRKPDPVPDPEAAPKSEPDSEGTPGTTDI
jgi:hypothetical protein